MDVSIIFFYILVNEIINLTKNIQIHFFNIEISLNVL
jgi:hypothetical protein